MLALLAKSQQSSSHIGAVTDTRGTLHHSTKDIMDVFKQFFQDVYSSKLQPSHEVVCSFLDRYPMPCLPASETALLNAALTEEELLESLAYAQNGLAPGTDGLLSEVYKQYSAQLIPILLKVYNWTFETGTLPTSKN